VEADRPTELAEAEDAPGAPFPLDFKTGITLMVVVLAAAVIVLALTDSRGTKSVTTTTVVPKTVPDPALGRQMTALATRVAAVDRTQAALGKTVGGLAKTVKGLDARLAAVAAHLQHARPPAGNTKLEAQLQAQLRALSARIGTFGTCLFQVQKQLDDIQAYALTRSALKKRVSGACLGLLQPRYAGG
jgi:hypothetical protein